MMHTFRLDVAVAAMLSEPRADGHILEIDCRTQQGEDCRLRLEFTPEGIVLFAEIMNKLVESYKKALGDDELPPAAEPVTVLANEDESRHIERYFVAHLSASELRRLTDELRSYGESGSRAPEFAGHDRVVLWRVPDPRVQNSDGGGYRVYLSAGALRAAAHAEIPVQLVGEISRRELPEGRELLIGDAPLDWQDTTVPNVTVALEKLLPSAQAHRNSQFNQTEGSMNHVVAQSGDAHTASAKPAEGPDRDLELRRFVAEHPHGWNHDEWLDLLERMRQRGHVVDAGEDLGRALEKQRLMMRLAQVRGVGLKRMQAITNCYPDVWSLRQAGIEGLVEAVKIPTPLAEHIQEVV